MPSRPRRANRHLPRHAQLRRAERALNRESRQEARATSRREKFNTLFTALAVLLSLPALAVSLLTYIDQRETEQTSDVKEAARINAWWAVDKKGTGNFVVVNRTLTGVTEVTFSMGTRQPKNLHFGYVSGCTKAIIAVSGDTDDIEVATNERFEFSFYNTLGETWVSEASGLRKTNNPYLLRYGSDLDEERKINYKEESLDSCS